MDFKFLSFFKNRAEEELLLKLQDDSRRQKQSDRIRRAIEQILNVFPEPTLIVSPEGHIRYFNQAFLETFSITKEYMPKYLSDIFREPQILSLIQGNPEQGSVKKEIQIALNESESKRYFTVFKTPFATRNEDATYDQLIIFHDVTSAKKTDQMKTDFVSNVSHELRTPLMSIKGYMQTLKEDIHAKKFDHVDQFFSVIESHVDRLSYLISDLLELSYLESEITLEKKEIKPKDLTQKIISQFQLDLQKGEYVVEAEYKTETAMVEDRLIEQVLINLIQNTLRYTPQKTKINISWERKGDKTILMFKDNGPGISEEHLSRIFERFYRIDPHRSRARGGTGLGLSIVKHIMQRHGGTVHVSSQLGYGLEFQCVFPD
jgi:two-component system phosphate regulon sensor histidine kinase PhoR